MTSIRQPRSRFYDGAFYARLLDPSLQRLHRVVATIVGAESKVLDIGCGTGSLPFIMAESVTEVVGVELSPAMIAYADRRRIRDRIENTSFVLGDAVAALADHPDGSFDVATMVLTLHEMPPTARQPLLQEVARVARRLLCVDFRTPMPNNLAGWRNRLAEIAAGRDHFRAFRDYGRRGGICGIAEAAGLQYHHRKYVDGASLEICELRGDG